MPTTLAEIELADVPDQDLMKVAEVACAPGETIHNELVPVIPALVFSASKAADVEGRRLKGL